MLCSLWNVDQHASIYLHSISSVLPAPFLLLHSTSNPNGIGAGKNSSAMVDESSILINRKRGGIEIPLYSSLSITFKKLKEFLENIEA